MVVVKGVVVVVCVVSSSVAGSSVVVVVVVLFLVVVVVHLFAQTFFELFFNCRHILLQQSLSEEHVEESDLQPASVL